jgi:hypothetical protein
VLLLALAITTTVAANPGPYAREARVAHLTTALDALRALGPDGRVAFERELHGATRAKCRATAKPAATACAIEVARGVCAGKPDPAGCAAAADVIATNQHAENDLVDEPTRVKLVRSATDYHAAVLAELDKIYALLAAEFALARPGGDRELPARIDRFCAERDRETQRCAPGTRGCVPSLAWQRCAAGLAWYVARSGDGVK